MVLITNYSIPGAFVNQRSHHMDFFRGTAEDWETNHGKIWKIPLHMEVLMGIYGDYMGINMGILFG
jgi:hypothetical protein